MSRRCGRKPIGSDVLKAANPGKAEGEEKGREERRGDSKEAGAEKHEARLPGPEPGSSARARLLASEVTG